MSETKKVLITGFALFSLFFGAGNLILPPFLGFNANSDWLWVTLGFALTAVVIPICAIIAHAKVQGTLFDLGKKVSPIFSYIYCILIYIIAIAIPSPRTASVTHEMAIQPYFSTSTLLTSSLYFAFVLLFVMNRSKILSIIGKFLTPLILVILAIIILIAIFSTATIVQSESISILDLLVTGTLEGYQTFDAIGGVVVGAVLVISINLMGSSSYESKKKLLTKSGIIAGLGLILIYAGLIYCGALYRVEFNDDVARTELLSGISKLTLGPTGNIFLSILVALACFTTAVGIVIGTADYFKKFFGDSQLAYTTTAIVGCIIGVVVGSYNVEFIIDFAVPALMFIYPITIALIFLNLLPKQNATNLVFRAVILTTLLFSIPDFIQTLNSNIDLNTVTKYIPLGDKGLGWVIPSFVVLIVLYFYEASRSKKHS